jgi:Carboxypeptidase regulatory-like domain
MRPFRCAFMIALVMRTAALELLAQALVPGHTQTVRGTVLDADDHRPVIGAAVAITAGTSGFQTTTDEEGRFAIAEVPTGRVDLRIRAVGYEEQLLPNLLVVSAKENVLQIALTSSVASLKEVQVTADRAKGARRNEMSTVSARAIGVEETSRMAGGINDPARMVSAFAGVASDPAGDNTIVVRGNSPKGVLWRLEGIEIPNPNHFSDEGSTGGPINVLNSDVIDDSEFHTGAFAPEFGNAYTAVFDMRMRTGNDSRNEYTLKVGVLGTDLTAEGPLPGTRGGSFLANYRYSTLAVLDDAGIVDFGGVPRYSDAAFKVRLPTARAGVFSLFGLGGKSDIRDTDTEGDTVFSVLNYASRMGFLGLSHTSTLGDRNYLYTTLSMAGNGSGTTYSERPDPEATAAEPRHFDDLSRGTWRFATTLNQKINARHKLRSGVVVSADGFRLRVDSYDEDLGRLTTQVDRTGNTTTFQAFTSWKWRWNEQWTMTSGVHFLYYALNGSRALEPRMAWRYQVQPNRAFTLGTGLHSRTDALMTYLAEQELPGGGTAQPNKDLGLTRSAHFVFGYEHMLAEDLHFKSEAYYQYHFAVPVASDSSAFTLANSTQWFTNRDLVNEGLGRTYGMELSLEKFFTHGYHFLVTTSVMRAENKALDGVWYASRFDMGVVANALGSKEWELGPAGKDRVLTTSLRYSRVGGQVFTPIDLEASVDAGVEVLSSDIQSLRMPAVTKLDVSIAYRVGRPNVGHEVKLDVQNVLNAKTNVYQYFNASSGNVEYTSQLAILPVLLYTLRF